MKLRFFPLCLFLTACGVKLPPVAPERPPPPPPPQKLHCSPYEPDCDAKDPNYRPRKK